MTQPPAPQQAAPSTAQPSPTTQPPPQQAPASTSAAAGESVPQAGQQRPDGVSDAEWSALGDPGKAAIVRERAAAAEAQRQAADALAKVRQFEDEKKTDTERATDALAAAQKAAAESTARADRMEAAAKAGLDLSLAPRLVGSTPAELEADAAKLAAMVTPAQPQQPAPPVPGPAPRPDLSAGAPGGGAPASLGEALSAHYGTTRTT